MTHALLSRSKEARQTYINEHQDTLDSLMAGGQTPSLMYIGCCDSRVDPEPLLGAKLGDVFVIRTVANIVPPAEDPMSTAIGAALEFGIDVLSVPHLAVCGHTDCGGIQAVERGAHNSDDHVHLRQWLALVDELIGFAREPEESDDAWHVRLVETNVLLQRTRLLKYPVVAHAVEAERLQLHAWYFDLHTRKMRYYDSDLAIFVEE